MRSVWTVLAILGVTITAHAQARPIAKVVADLGSEDRALQQAAIVELGVAENVSQALPVLEALLNEKLTVASDGSVVIDTGAGLRDALTGKTVAASSGLRKPLLTNLMRRAVGSAVAQLQLRSNKRSVRIEAATVLSKGPAVDVVPAMRAALKREGDAEIKRLLSLGLAQADLGSDERDQRIAALEVIREAADASFKPRLEALLARNGDAFMEPDAQVREAARSALSAIELKELGIRVVRDLFYGASLGSVLLLAALGLAITFGLMGVINMAHGEMLMLGAYTTYAVQRGFQIYAPSAIDWYLPAALPAAFLVCMAMGVILERTIIRFLYGRPLETLLATFGVSLLLIQSVRLIFGASNVAVANPSYLSGGYELVDGVVLPYARLSIIVFVVAVVLFVGYLLTRTRLGLQVRAITQNRPMAAAMGIRTARIDMLTFGVGSAVAGLGGVALSQIGNVGPELGQNYIVDSFMVVVVGGVGKLIGTVVTSLGLGVVNKVLEPFAGAVLGKILVLAFVIVFIQRKPKGLFALKGRAVD